LLFAVGALAAIPGASLDIAVITALLMVAAIAGDTVNYGLGKVLGERAFRGEFRFISQKHMLRAKEFYERHGGKAIVFARFAPILRTFAPFVAGLGQMSYRRFLAFNIGGGVAWVGSFTLAGYWFGNIPAVKSRFHIVVIAIVVISLIPAAIEAYRARSDARPAV
jgi:membrane-associated protein